MSYSFKTIFMFKFPPPNTKLNISLQRGKKSRTRAAFTSNKYKLPYIIHMLTGPPTLASIFPTVLFTGSGVKQKFL